MRPRNGKHTVAEYARKIIESGHGLSEREIEKFQARIEAVRRRRMGARGAVDEFRAMIERKYPS